MSEKVCECGCDWEIHNDDDGGCANPDCKCKKFKEQKGCGEMQLQSEAKRYVLHCGEIWICPKCKECKDET